MMQGNGAAQRGSSD